MEAKAGIGVPHQGWNGDGRRFRVLHALREDGLQGRVGRQLQHHVRPVVALDGLHRGGEADRPVFREAGRRDPSLPEETWRYLTRWISEDGLKPHISHRIPFSRAAEALQLVLDRKVIGKAVLVPDG